MSGKRLEKIDSLSTRQNQKNPWDKVTYKQKAQKSFSIPRKLRSSVPSTTKPSISQLRQQEKGMDARASSSSNIQSCSDDDDVWETDVSVGQMRSSDAQSRSDDGGWESDSSVEQMRSANVQSRTDDGGWETDVSVEQMRSSDFFDFRNHDGGPIASTPFSPSKDKGFHFSGSIESIEKAVPTVPSQQFYRNIPTQCGGGQFIPNVSYIVDDDDEYDTLKDTNFHLKSISPKQIIELPAIFEVNKESQEQSADSITYSKVPTSDGFEISRYTYQPVDRNFTDECVEQNFGDECVAQNFDDEYVEQSFDEEEDGATIIKRWTNVNPRRRKHNDKIGNSSEDMDNQNSGDSFEGNQNIQTDTPKKKGKLYRGVGIKSNSHVDRPLKRKIEEEISFEDMNTSHTENRFEDVQNIQNEELQGNELGNNSPEIATHQRRKTNKRVGVDNKTQQNAVSIPSGSHNPTTLRRKHAIERGNSFEDMNKSDNEDSFKNVQNNQNEQEMQRDELNNKSPETDTHQRKRKINKRVAVDNKKQQDVGILNGSQNSNQMDELENNLLETATHQRKRKINKRVAFDNKTQQDVVSIPSGSFNSRSLRRKHAIERGNSFEDMNKSDNEDSFENVPNIQNEQEMQLNELDNNSPETATHQRKRKMNKRVAGDNKTQQDVGILNGSQNSTQGRRKRKDQVENSVKDIFSFDSEDTFEESQNVQVDSPEKKRKRYRKVAVKRYSRGSRSKKAANSLSRSKNSTGVEDCEHVQNNQNEAKKSQWPVCCLKTVEKRTFSILKPVIRDDFPIDTLTLMLLGKDSKKKCKH